MESRKMRFLVSFVLLGALVAVVLVTDRQRVNGSAYDLFVQTSSVTVTNTTTETTVVGSGIGSTTIPGNFLQASDTLRLIVLGHLSTAVALPGTLRIKAKLGSTTIADTGAQGLTANVTNAGFFGISFTTFRTAGASASTFTQGRITVPDSLLTNSTWPMVNTAAQTIDSTANQVLDVTAQFGTASSSNSLTITNLHFSKAP